MTVGLLVVSAGALLMGPSAQAAPDDPAAAAPPGASAKPSHPSHPSNPYFNANKPHHTPDGFQNLYIGGINKQFTDLLRWRISTLIDRLPPAPKTPTPTQAPDLARIHANAKAGAAMQPMLTWVGHATTLVQASGLNVLTDPIFSERASPVQLVGPKRQQPPGVAMQDLPPIDVVVISHNHYDHLDRQSVFELDQRAKKSGQATLFLVPLGIKPWMADIGISNVVELDWWDKHRVKGVDFYLTPVQHWSARGLGDRSKTLWGGWSVFGADFHWYFSGDAGYSKDFADTRAHFDAHLPAAAKSAVHGRVKGQTNGLANGQANGQESRQANNPSLIFDLALLAVGAYEPRWFMKEQHINPLEAVQAFQDLGAAQAIGIHWGTFELTDEALDQPPIALAAAKQQLGVVDEAFFLLRIGQSWVPALR